MVLLSVDGTQDVPLYFRNSPETGIVVVTSVPCNLPAFQRAVLFSAENWVPPVRVRPVPAL